MPNPRAEAKSTTNNFFISRFLDEYPPRCPGCARPAKTHPRPQKSPQVTLAPRSALFPREGTTCSPVVPALPGNLTFLRSADGAAAQLFTGVHAGLQFQFLRLGTQCVATTMCSRSLCSQFSDLLLLGRLFGAVGVSTKPKQRCKQQDNRFFHFISPRWAGASGQAVMTAAGC